MKVAVMTERMEKRKMGTFMQIFERVAEKYAAYMEEKLEYSLDIKELKPGQEFVFREPREKPEQLMFEMQTLNQIAQTLKDMPVEDVIGLDQEKLHVTEAELEEFNKKTVCHIEKNEETGAVEIMPGISGKIILNDIGQIKVFLKIVGSYLKEMAGPEGIPPADRHRACL